MSSTAIMWNTWCGSTTSSTATTTYDNVWVNWASAGTSTTTYADTSTDIIWQTWSDSTTTYRVVQVANPVGISPEQRAEQARQAEAAAAARRTAEARAMELLRANLSQRQREALDKNGWFMVEGGRSKKQYRVHGTGRMEEMEGDAAVASFCVHADYTIPMPDQVLAKALCIALDEDYILRTANRTPLRVAA